MNGEGYTEQFMTDVLDKAIATTYGEQWETLTPHQKYQAKEAILPLVLATIEAVDTVRGDVQVAYHFPVQDMTVIENLIASEEGDDGRSEWNWFHTADGDLIAGIFPTGAMYEALEPVVEADYLAALEMGTDCKHTVPSKELT